ncbi:MAG: substrate-binding domain-containing protein [Pseudomonadota bacterium]
MKISGKWYVVSGKFVLWGLLGILLFFSNVVFSTERLKIATTTSLDNSGLLEKLIKPFEKENNIKIYVIAVGTGKAIKLAENGDVDLIMTHAKEAELKFIKEGYGVERKEFAYNDFVILGPPNDPSIIKGLNSVDAFRKISRGGNIFISRGDDSGTHKKELKIWENIKIKPKGKWYLEVGQGMGASLQIADQKEAYILCDRGTFLAYKGKIKLEILVEDFVNLKNQYSITAVNPKKHKHVNANLVKKFIEFVTGNIGQKIIQEFKINNQNLFVPNAIAISE